MLYVLLLKHPVKGLREEGNVHIQKLTSRFQQHLSGGIAVPFLREFIECIQQAAAKPNIFVVVKTHFFGNGVSRAKPDAPDVIRKAIGVFLHDLDTVFPIGFVDLCGMGCGDIVRLEKQHDIFDFLLFLPAGFDPLNPDGADAGDLQQLIRPLLNHIQGFRPEGVDDTPGEFRADALHQAGPEILFDPGHCGGQRFLTGLGGKLPSVFRIHFPVARHKDHCPHMGFRHGPHHSDQVVISLCPAFDDRITILFILVGNSLHDTA